MALRTLSSAPRTLAKYLQGVSAVVRSVECEKGQAFPAWHCPVLKNLQGTCEVSAWHRSVRLVAAYALYRYEALLLVFGGLRGPSNAPRLIVPLCREPPFGI